MARACFSHVGDAFRAQGAGAVSPGRFYPSAGKVRNVVIMQNSKEHLVKRENKEFPTQMGFPKIRPCSHDMGKNFLPELRQPLLDLSSDV